MALTDYWKALQGCFFWNKIDRKYCASIYILMPEEKDVYNYYALLHLRQFLEERGQQKAVVLTCDEEAIAALNLFFPICNSAGSRMPRAKEPVRECLVKAVYIGRNTAGKLLKYYALYEFTPRMVIVSLTRPYDTHAQNLLGLYGVGKEELVCFDIYRLREKPEAVAPRYGGTDEKITAFLDRGRKTEKSVPKT